MNIFDLNPTPEELSELGFDQGPSEYVKYRVREDMDLDLSFLYLMRGDEEKAKEYRDKVTSPVLQYGYAAAVKRLRKRRH